MSTTEKRKNKVKALKEQIEQGTHPLQNQDLEQRKKAAESVAQKIITKSLNKKTQKSDS